MSRGLGGALSCPGGATAVYACYSMGGAVQWETPCVAAVCGDTPHAWEWVTGCFWAPVCRSQGGDVRVWPAWPDVVCWLAGWLWRQAVPCVCEQLNARLAQEPTSWVGWGKYLDGTCWGHNTKETITRGAVPCALCTAGRLKHSTCWVCPACVCLGLCGYIRQCASAGARVRSLAIFLPQVYCLVAGPYSTLNPGHGQCCGCAWCLGR